MGERGTNMAAAGILRFLCVHFVLAAHVVALNCEKLSTQQAASSMACGMPIGGEPHRHLRLF